MLGILTITGALVVVGVMVWYQIRFPVIPPNVRMLQGLWRSMDGQKITGQGTKGKNSAHATDERRRITGQGRMKRYNSL